MKAISATGLDAFGSARCRNAKKIGLRILMHSSNYSYVPIRSSLQWRRMGKQNDPYHCCV